jgi:hypothetical protein
MPTSNVRVVYRESDGQVLRTEQGLYRTPIEPGEAFIFCDHHPDPTTSRIVNGEIVKHEDNITYKKRRASAYPDVTEQLDMLWHAMASGQIPKAEPFYSEIKAVKDQFPKQSN